MKARGQFEVKLLPQATDEQAGGTALGRLSLDKQFSGDLVATSKGEMLSAMTATRGSAGYVAIERVTGSLQGRAGSFVLQHSGSMTRGAGTLLVTVVPDSGTGELAGLSGHMSIIAEGGRHDYEFNYVLA